MTPVEKFLDLPLEEVIGDRFGRYSKYIIQERALPDARDGLKPVQRRILYSMHVEGNTAEKGYRKAAKTVGNVIGNYHPHGDFSVYEAMVRMSQDWKLRKLLIEMHGNNGSMDGDSAAAMRYTETRLTPIASELLRDIEKDTVDFIPNFDDTSEEPIVLPAMFPHLLVNGSAGIAAGYATDIPPHHIGEVIDATIMKIDKPDVTVDQLLTVIKGPDFPTGGIIQGIEGIKNAYKTGRGRIIIRGKAAIESIRGGREQIVVTEIPYDVNKANLVKKIDEFRIDRKLEGISEVRDETDRTGLRIVIELRKDADAQGILNYLYKSSDLQIAYNFNMVAIHNMRPTLMGLGELLEAYIEHKKEIVTRRSTFELNKAEERLHIVAGLMLALSILDEVIEAIRASKDKRDAKNNLMKKFDFTDAQAEAIVSLQLYRLTNTDITALQGESDELTKKVATLRAILSSETKLMQVIKKELKEIKKKYNDERRSVVEAEIEELKIDIEVTVPSEDVIVTLTEEGYVKRTSLRSYSASNGEDLAMKDTDVLLHGLEMNTTDTLLVFTNKGNYLYCPVHELPDIRWKDLGQHIANIVPIDSEEEVIGALAIKEFTEEQFIFFVTKSGMVKKSVLKQYDAQRRSRALVAINLKDGDELIAAHLSNGSQDVLLTTHFGSSLRFNEQEINATGVRTRGVIGINVREDDYVVSGQLIDEEKDLVVAIVTQRGAMKKMRLNEIERTTRARRGMNVLRELKAHPHRIVHCALVTNEARASLLTEKGQTTVIDMSELRYTDSYSNGSFVTNEEKDGKVTRVSFETMIKE